MKPFRKGNKMKLKFRLIIFAILIFSGFSAIGQNPEEPLSLGKGFLKVDGVEKEILIEKGILFRSTAMVYDTVVWIESESKARPLFYPQLIKGTHALIRLTARDVQNPDVFYDVFLEFLDSLQNRYALNTSTARAYIIRNGELHDAPYQMKSLKGEFIVFSQKKEEYEVSLYFDLLQHNNGQDNYYDFKASFTLPAFKYRESDVATPVAKKAKQKIYKRNMQLAGLMVMIFLAIFFFD